MRDLWRPSAVAAGLLVPFLVLGACKSGSDMDRAVPEPPESAPMSGFTHDGAVPIAVITSFEDTRRMVREGASGTDADAAAGAACTFLSEDAQERLVDEARAKDLIGRKGECVDAMLAVVASHDVPAKASAFYVSRAEDDVTEVTVTRADGTAEAYTLTGSRAKESWAIDAVAADGSVEVPVEADATADVDGPTREEVLSQRKQPKPTGTPEYASGATGTSPVAPTVTELPAKD